MNQESQYTFNIYHFLLNFRDTMEFVLDREHPVALYQQRKTVIENGLNKNSALGNFIENNKEKTEKLVERLHEFLDDMYGPSSTIVKVAGDTIRVDHSQNIKILEETVQLGESIRDILYGYVNHLRSQGKLDEDVYNLVVKDEKMYRLLVAMLCFQEYLKSFREFQKVMSETKGKPTPQSNFIVQNELNKLAGLIRFSRAHAHNTDNLTLDILDRLNQVLEMCEGRRERRNNKDFGTIFNEISKEISETEHVNELLWKEQYEKTLQIVLKQQQDNKAQADAIKVIDEGNKA